MLDVDVLQVVLARAADRRASRRPAGGACSGTGIERLPDEVLAGDRRLRLAAGPCTGPEYDDLAAVLARARADVDDLVGDADRLLVVLDDDHGVAEVAQADRACR